MKSLNYIFTLILSLFFFLLSQNINSQQLAFPTAEGAAAYTTGGRGGTVSIVTNLNDSGPGSVRSFANVSNTTIVFNVSGIIKLSRVLIFRGNNVTIAGQTAPEGGITFEGSRIIFQNNRNLIVRYLRFRNGKSKNNFDDSISGFGLIDVIFDHCSISFGGDEAIELVVDTPIDQGGAITIQNCLIAESKTGSIMGASATTAPNNFGSLSMIGNVWYNITHRVPNVVGNARVDVINNYVHNAKWRLTRGNGGYKLNQLNNVYDFGNNTVWDVTLNMHGCDSRYGFPSIYANGNTIIGNQGNGGTQLVTSTISEMNANNRLMWKYYYDNNSSCGFGRKMKGDQLESAFFSNKHHPILGVVPTIYKASELRDKIVPNIGASKRLNSDGSVSDNTDILDVNWKRNIMEGNYIVPLNMSNYATPSISSIRRSSDYDSDNDGMPDAWEMKMFNTLEHDGTNDSFGNGYTDLEEFLNQVDSNSETDDVWEGITANAGKDQTICLGSTTTLTATGGSNYLWNTGAKTASIDVSPTASRTYTVTAYDPTGKISDKAQVRVNVISDATVSAGNDVTITSGESITLKASGADSYRWSTGENRANIRVSPKTTTTYIVIGYLKECGEGESSVKVTVLNSNLENDENNIYVTSDHTIFLGESTILEASGGSSYIWNTGPGTSTISNDSSIEVVPSTSRTYTVTSYDDKREVLDISNVHVKVIRQESNIEDKVEISTDQIINLGESTTLKVTGGSAFLWSTGPGTATISNNSSIVVTPSTSRFYHVIVYDRNGEVLEDSQIYITVTPSESTKNKSQISKDQMISLGESATLKASGGSSYIWNTGPGTSTISTNDSIVVTPSTSRTYYVVVYDSNNDVIGDYKINVTVIFQPFAKVARGGDVENINQIDHLEDPVNFRFSIYPNPTEGELHINISNVSNFSSIHLYDFLGKSLYNENIKDNDERSYSRKIDLSSYKAGVYLIKLVGNKEVITRKIILR